MDWMKVEKSTPRKPEVLEMAAMLELDPDAVFGKLFRLWSWADDNTEDGNARGVTLALLDLTIGVSGFARAMADVGWLELLESSSSNPRGGLKFVNFDRHNGQTAKRRALTAARVAKHKAAPQENGNARSVTSSVSDALPREEKRREEVNTHTPARLVAVEVSEAIKTWHEYWRTSHGCGKPDSEVRVDAMLAKAMSARWLPDKIVAAIRFGITKNAKSWLDPDADFEKLAKDRANKIASNSKRATIAEGM